MNMTIRNFALLITMTLGLLLNAHAQHGQDDKSKRPSPPAQVSQVVDSVLITIDYSQPSLKGRDINKLAPVAEVWRTGANEASWISVSEDVLVEEKPLPKGKYGLFTINNKSEWTIIFNKTWNQWGAYSYKSEDDVLRVTIPSQAVDGITEKFTIEIGEDGLVQLKWGRVVVPFQITKA